MSEVDLSIITVGFKSREYIRALLNSLFSARSNLSIEYFVIDNSQDDGMIAMVEKEFVPRADERLQIFPIQSAENLGFAKANNIGIARARGRYVLLLNPDMRLLPDTLTNMVAWMDAHQHAGVAGCKLQTPDGATQSHVRAFPTLWDQLAIILKLPHVFPHLLDRYLMKNFDYEKAARVDSIRGSFFCIRQEVIQKVGGLDERYFIWFEEVDYCKMALAAGFEIWYTPAATCIDFVGRSFSLVGGYQKQKYFSDSMKKYFSKWQSPAAALLIRVAWAPVLFAAKLFS